MPRVSRLRRSVVLPVLVTALLAIPLGYVLAGGQTFNDVPPSHPFFNDIEAVAAAGVTGGCGDGSNYCPNQNVTRAQMAAFLNRLGALGPGKTPVANARTAQSTDGWSLGCPSGTTWSQGLCFETTNRAAETVYAAADTCASLGSLIGGFRWRLPTIHQLRSARAASGITLDAAGEHTDSLFVDEGAFYSIVAFDGGTIAHLIGNTTREFRCVTSPQSFDPFIIVLPGEESLYPAPPQYGDAQVDETGRPLNADGSSAD